MARGIGNACKEIAQLKGALSPEQETDLNMHLLNIIFRDVSNELGTCWTIFDHKVAQTLSKTITLVTKKIHKDYRIEFEEQLNGFMSTIKKKSSHLDYVYDMPDRIVY